MKIVNYARGFLFLFWLYGSMMAMGIVFLPLLVAPRRWAQWIVRVWVRQALAALHVLCGIKFVIEGRENIPKTGALIACKHQSMADVLWPFTVWNEPALIFKKELSFIPVFGWFVGKLQNVMVDRKGHAIALRKMVRQASALAEQGRPILIFPEGTRTEPGQTLPYKPGIAALYQQMKVPCVPVALNSGVHWPAHGMKFTPGIIIVRILPPIVPGLSRKEFMQALQGQIETAANDLLA